MAHHGRRMPFEAPDAIACQFEAFRKKFGRDPGPDDPIFFDPDPAFIYAFKRTGRIVTESNKHRLTEKELRRWNDAISEYEHKVDSCKVI